TRRARMSEPPPAGNGTIMVICFEGKLCAWAVAPASARIKATTPDSVFIFDLFPTPCEQARAPDGMSPSAFPCNSRLLDLDAVGLDDRPPLVDFGLVEVVQCL